VKERAGVFVRSLRKTGYKDAIVLGVAPNLPPEEEKWLKKYQVTAHVVRVGKCKYELGKKSALCDEMTGLAPVALSRFTWYREWIEARNYTGYILVSDVQDVFFQSNPFIGLRMDHSQPVVEVAVEFGWDEPKERNYDKGGMRGSYIGTSGFNRGWIGGCMGDQASRAMHNHKVLCSGTTLGTRSGMDAYLRLVNDEISARLHNLHKNHGGCMNFGVDQGYHNYVLYTNMKEHTSGLQMLAPEWNSASQTLVTIGNACNPPPSTEGKAVPPDHSWNGTVKRDYNGYVLRSDDSRAPVVHQWDRCSNQFSESGFLDREFPEVF
jgi:hypothetical protein